MKNTRRLHQAPSVSPTSPTWKEPSHNRIEEMKDILWDREMLHVYCDASEATKDKRVIGVASTYVWDGNVVTRGKKHYERVPTKEGNILGEIVALLFGLTEIPSVLNSQKSDVPQNFIVNTDYNRVVEWLNDETTAPPKRFEHLLEKIQRQKALLEDKYYGTSISIVYIDKERKRNPYYRASHNRARKEVDIYSGRSRYGKR